MLIPHVIAELTRQAIREAQGKGALPTFDIPEVTVQPPRRPEFGDFSTSICLQVSRMARMAPLKVAEVVVNHFPPAALIGQVDVAQPGFLNFALSADWLVEQVGDQCCGRSVG